MCYAESGALLPVIIDKVHPNPFLELRVFGHTSLKASLKHISVLAVCGVLGMDLIAGFPINPFEFKHIFLMLHLLKGMTYVV